MKRLKGFDPEEYVNWKPVASVMEPYSLLAQKSLKAMGLKKSDAILLELYRNLLLVRPPLIHETHHRMSFGHLISHGILGQGQAGHEDDSVALVGSEQAARIDRLDALGVARLREEVCLGVDLGGHPLSLSDAQKSGQV